MAQIAPLKPLRYANIDSLPKLIAPPYDVISTEERTSLLLQHPHNIVQLILPEPSTSDADSKYTHAARQLNDWVQRKVLVRDEEPGYYHYEQRFVITNALGHHETICRQGFFALVRLVPFSAQEILPHERTLLGPKEDRLKLFRATQTNLSPGFMLYCDPEQKLEQAFQSRNEIVRFQSQFASELSPIEHVFSKISDPHAIQMITQFVEHKTLLIADGHHRYETALRYCEEINGSQNTNSYAEHRYFMVFLVNENDPGLHIFPTHRLVHSVPTRTKETWLERIRDAFEIKPLTFQNQAKEYMVTLAKLGTQQPSFVVVTDDQQAQLLTLRADFNPNAHASLQALSPALQQTDVALLHSLILEHALGINHEAQANQTHLTYFKDAEEAIQKIHTHQGDLLFLMNATPVSQVRAVAETGEVMPQKSTYFYPKIPTGLLIHTLNPMREVAFV